jgi:hypothetical protein
VWIWQLKLLKIVIKLKTAALQNEEQQMVNTIQQNIKFSFLADHHKTIHHNASIQLAKMPTWYYFACPTHLAFYDFTTTKMPPKNL